MRRAFIALLIVASACSRGTDHAAPPTSTGATSTSAPAPTTTAPGGCAVPARAEPDPNRPRYVLHVTVAPAEHHVRGDLTVRFTPDIATDRLVFRLWPNGPRLATSGAHLAVGQVQLGSHTAASSQPDPTTLVVPLDPPLSAGRTIEATVPWDLTLAGPNNDRIAQVGDSIRLGSFFPILAWEPGVGWATEPPVSGFAEASSAPAADIDMSLDVPAGLDVLATGEPDAGRTRWHGTGVRDVAVSIGHFRIAQADASGVHITVGVDQSLADSAPAYATKLASRIDAYSQWFGSYPWRAYTVSVTPSLRGGIEYPMHVMQGPGSIGRTTSHELGHQWFYGLVGDDQGRDPWLDEGLASFAEGQAEDTFAQRRATAIPADGRGHMTSPMSYWDMHQATYYRGVYVQGALALAALGPLDRVDCALRIYVARNAYRIARPADLAAAATEVFADAREKLAPYGVGSTP